MAGEPTAHEVMRRWFAKPDPSLLHPTIEWHVPGYPVPRSVYLGPEAVFGEFFPALRRPFGTWGAKVRDMFPATDGERVTVLGDYEGTTLSGGPVSIPFIHVWTVRDGMVVHVVSGADTAALAAAAASQSG